MPQLIRISMNFKCSPRGAYIGCRLNKNIDRLQGPASQQPLHNAYLVWVFIARKKKKTVNCQDALVRKQKEDRFIV